MLGDTVTIDKLSSIERTINAPGPLASASSSFPPPFVAGPSDDALGSDKIASSHESSDINIQRTARLRVAEHVVDSFESRD